MTSIPLRQTAPDRPGRWRPIARMLLALPLALLALGACRDERVPTAPTARANALVASVPGFFTQLSAHQTQVCGLRNDGVVECWGNNNVGQAPAVRTATTGSYTFVTVSSVSGCAVRTDGAVECWGTSSYQQAPRERTAAAGHVFTQVSLDLAHACGLREDGVVECWGFNTVGEAPALKTAAAGHVFTQLDVGYAASCAVREDGVVECWGTTTAARVQAAGNGVFTNVSAGYFSTCAVRNGDGAAECWGPGALGTPLPMKVPLSGKFTQVSAHTTHACAVRDDGVVECWGGNEYGQAPATKTASDNHRFTQVAASTRSSCALRDDGVVECWGDNSNGQAPAIKTAGGVPVGRVSPTASFTATPATVGAGSSFSLTLSDAQVPGYPGATTFTFAFDCGDGAGYGAFGTLSTATCGTTITVGQRTVKGTVRDQDGDVAEYTATVDVVADNTPPIITPTVTGTLGSNGWYTSAVTVTWSVSDPQSAVSMQTGCGATAITTDTPGLTLTCRAESAGGSNVQEVTIKRDGTKPTLAPSVAPRPVVLNVPATAAPNASDALSGVASATCGTPSVTTVGTRSVSCTATDNAGNQVSASATYTVAYQFGAFTGPIAGNGVLNVAKAGQTIPLKWRLVDGNGLPVTTVTTATVTVASLSCALGASTDAVEEYTSGASGLQNLGDGYYQYNWKTPKDYAGSCKTMQLDLGEGFLHSALFQFTK